MVYPAGVVGAGLWGSAVHLLPEVAKSRGVVSGRPLEGVAGEGESPVHENLPVFVGLFPSSTEPVEFGVNLAGPPAKPEYFLVTDSGRVP